MSATPPGSLFSLRDLRQRVTARGQEGVPALPSMTVSLKLIGVADAAWHFLDLNYCYLGEKERDALQELVDALEGVSP